MSMKICNILNLFWRHRDCRLIFKMRVHNAVVRSKLLYGLKPAHLTFANKRKLDVLQLKSLRKMLKWKTIYVERVNTNERDLGEKKRRLEAQRRNEENRQGKDSKGVIIRRLTKFTRV